MSIDDDVGTSFLVHSCSAYCLLCLLVGRSIFGLLLNGEMFVFYEPVSTKEMREKKEQDVSTQREKKKKKKRKCLAFDLGEFFIGGPGSNNKSCDRWLLVRRIVDHQIDLVVEIRQVVVEVAQLSWQS